MENNVGLANTEVLQEGQSWIRTLKFTKAIFMYTSNTKVSFSF